jgi:hypothetical protein
LYWRAGAATLQAGVPSTSPEGFAVTVDQREKLCLALAVLAEALPLAYLALTWRRTSRLASLGRTIAWWVVACMPFAMAYGNVDAAWPYGYDYPVTEHRFRWDLLAHDVAVGYLIVCGLGRFSYLTTGGPRPSGTPADLSIVPDVAVTP